MPRRVKRELQRGFYNPATGGLWKPGEWEAVKAEYDAMKAEHEARKQARARAKAEPIPKKRYREFRPWWRTDDEPPF